MRILLVDDDPSVVEALKRLLESELDDVEVWVASSAAEGLDVLGCQGDFDLVVTDLRMPVMDGADLLQQCYRRWPRTVRVVLSGHMDTASAARAFPRAHLVLAKPCGSTELLYVVARARTWRSILTGDQGSRVAV